VAEAGERIGPYRMLARLGAGAMGEVWRARDERLDRVVAIKVLPADFADNPERKARMLREARAAAAVPHPNVVTLFDVVSEGDRDVLVMELVDGQTLSDVLRDGKPALGDSLRWIESLADALAAAHARGILHRDIKSANVMITAARDIKVLDFGLAKLVGDTKPVAPETRPQDPADAPVALDETMPSAMGSDPAYATRAGSLLGTPMYMAPEQIAGNPPDERSEVFSVGVIAYELLAGKPPYQAATMEALFVQIANRVPPPIEGLADDVAAIVTRALEKDPAARWPSMAVLRDAIAAVRRRRQKPRRWPLAVAAGAIAIAGAAVAIVVATRGDAPAEKPGDAYVRRALEEYDVFYNDKAMSSLRAALRVAPDHPRAAAYSILFEGAPPADRAAGAAAADRAIGRTPARSKERALLDAAIALERFGPRAARDALRAAGAAPDRELAFWTAELAYRAGDHAGAATNFRALLDDPAPRFRGRIYDHYSAVLLYLDDPVEAVRIGTLYRDAFPAEADAIGVHATTLAAAGRFDEAVAEAEQALALAEGEDTLAGLAKVLALRGDRERARALYRQSLDRAGPGRRPIRRAALAFLQWIDGDVDGARATVAPCLGRPRSGDPAATGPDAGQRERGACLFVAGVIDPALAPAIADDLERLAADATDVEPAYGAPASLAGLVRARARFFGGGCLVDEKPAPAPADVAALDAMYAAPLDFYAAYHVPFFATWAICERAALRAATGDRAGAAMLLRPVAERAPGRTWLVDDVTRYENASGRQ
jgi:tetratricopeptide (TPR) repeat protein